MKRGWIVGAGVLGLAGTLALGVLWWTRQPPGSSSARTRQVEAPPPGSSSNPVPGSDDPFPLDRRTRVYSTRQGRWSEGVLAYERAVTGGGRLSDGLEYLVVETRVFTRSTGTRRVVSREWLRSTPEGVFCGRRDEGFLVCEIDPPQPLVLRPLSLGRTWSWSGRAGGRPTHMKCTVAACERVTVGAGTFSDAWRIDSEVGSDEGSRDTIRRSLWLQPGVGLVEERSTIVVDGRALELDAALRE